MLDRYVIQKDIFSILPHDLFIKIISYFDPVFIAQSISLINTYFHFLANKDELWLHKFELHFPHRLAEYERKMKPLNQASFKFDAYVEFIQAYQYDYQPLIPEVRTFFSIAKENNSVNWVDKGKLILPTKWLYTSDSSQHSLLFWLKKNKYILNNLYQLKKKLYTNNNKIDTKKMDRYDSSIFYWAFVLDQDLDEIKFLISQGSQLDKICGEKGQYPIHLAAREGRLDLVQFIINEQTNLLNSRNNFDQTPLTIAASKGHLDIVEYLLEQPGIDIQATSRCTHPGMNAIHYAAEFGHTDIVFALIKAGMDPSVVVSKSTPSFLPIHFAAKSGFLDLVDSLIKYQPHTIDVLDCYGQPPFLWAASMGYLRLVQYFIHIYLNKKADINLNMATNYISREDHGKTMLHWAAQNGHLAVVLELLKAGINFDTTKCAWLPIHLAAKNGHSEIVMEFLKRQPELFNVPDKNGNTLLIYAVKHQDLSLVKYLLSQKGIDTHANNHSAIYFAAQGQNSEIVAALLKAGANINQLVNASNDQLPIHSAIYANNLASVKMLIEHQPEILNQTDHQGRTPLMVAAQNCYIEIIKYFLSINDPKNSLDVNAKNQYGQTALHLAARWGNDEIVALLLKAGAEQTPTCSIYNMRFPIHYAATASNNSSKVIKLLIDDKPDMLNVTDINGCTPLMVAAVNDNDDAIMSLFENEEKNNRVNIHAKTKEGKTALHIAAENAADRTVEILIAAGLGTSLDLMTPITKDRMWLFTKIHNKIKQLEEKNNTKTKSQFNHTFNFYNTSFGDKEESSKNPFEFEFKFLEKGKALKR